MGRCLSDIRRHVICCLLDSQHHDGDNYGNTDTGQNSKCAGTDELVWVLPWEEYSVITPSKWFKTALKLELIWNFPHKNWCATMTLTQCCGFLTRKTQILDWDQKTRCYLQGPLEGADGQQSQVLLLFCIPHQVYIHQLLKLQSTSKSKSKKLKHP